MTYHHLGFGLPSLPPLQTPWQLTVNTAAAVTPTGLMWLAPPDVQAAAAKQTSPITKAQIQRVGYAQSLLAKLGLYKGPVNGSVDRDTQSALDTFRSAVGMPTGGGVTDTDIGAMQQAVASLAAQQGIQIDTSSLPPFGFGAESSSGLPSWAIPVGVAALGLVVVLALRRSS